MRLLPISWLYLHEKMAANIIAAIFSGEYIGPVLYFRFMDDVIFVLYLQM